MQYCMYHKLKPARGSNTTHSDASSWKTGADKGYHWNISDMRPGASVDLP